MTKTLAGCFGNETKHVGRFRKRWASQLRSHLALDIGPVFESMLAWESPILNACLSPGDKLMARQTLRNHGDGTVAKKRIPKKTARKPATKLTKATGKKPTKRPDAKPIARRLTEPTKSPAKNTTVETATTTSKHATQEGAKPKRTWIVWQDGTGVWVGTPQEFRYFKRPETIVCDVIDFGTHRDSDALHRAIQLGQVFRQSYANCMKPWLQYKDAEQKQRIQEWQERLRYMGR